MSKIIYSTILFLFVPTVIYAQSEDLSAASITVGDQDISYAEAISIDGGMLYYNKNTNEPDALMVASSHDTNGDGLTDAWFVYNTNQDAVTEAYDTTGDGSADIAVSVDVNGDVVSITGEKAAEYTYETASPFNPEPVTNVNQEQDLVGDVSDISIVQKDNNWIFFVILFAAGALLFLFWKRQN